MTKSFQNILMLIMIIKLTTQLDLYKDLIDYPCHGYFTTIASENILGKYFNEKIQMIEPCNGSEVKITYQKFVFTKVYCNIRFMINAMGLKHLTIPCHEAVLRMLDDVPLKAWGEQYKCSQTNKLINISNTYKKKLNLPTVDVQTWRVNAVVYCNVQFLNISVDVPIVCNMTEDGGYRWEFVNQSACLYSPDKLKIKRREEIRKFTNNYTDSVIKEKLFYNLEILSVKNSYLSDQDFDFLCYNMKKVVDQIVDSESGIILRSIVENMVYFLNRIPSHSVRIIYVFRPFMIWIQALRFLQGNIDISSDLSTGKFGQAGTRVDIINIYKRVSVAGMSVDYYVYCLVLPTPKYITEVNNSIYPCCLAFINMRNSYKDGLIKKSFDLIFPILRPESVRNATCVRVLSNGSVIQDCRPHLYTGGQFIQCYCDYMNAVYTIQAAPYVEPPKPEPPEPIPTRKAEVVDYISIIIGCFCLTEYIIIKYTSLITWYPHIFLYDLDSHLDFFLCHIGILTLRNIAVYEASGEGSISCATLGLFLYVTYLFHSIFLLGITLNIFLFLQFPTSYFFVKFSAVPIVAFICAISVTLTNEIDFNGYLCVPGKLTFMIFAASIPTSFMFGMTLVIGIICFFIRANNFKWEIGGVFLDMVMGVGCYSFLAFYRGNNRQDTNQLYWFGICMMLEVIVISLYHICFKKDILLFYQSLRNKKSLLLKKTRSYTSFLGVS